MEEDLVKLDALFDSIIDEIMHPEKAGTFVNPFAKQEVGEIEGLSKAVAVVSVRISPDGMTAFANVMSKSENHKPFSAGDISRAAAQAGVFYGIDDEAIKDLAERQIINTDVVIASGIKPADGTDGKLKLRFDVTEQKKIPNIETGAEICHLVAPRPGRDGKDVYGHVVPAAQGAAAEFKAGDGISKKGSRYYAEYGGTLVCRHGVYSIVDEQVIDKNIDQSDGVITYTGTIIINGNVSSKGVVKAGRSVIVRGTVSNCVIEAGKDISVEGRVTNATLTAKGGNITGNDFEEATLVAGGSVNAAILNGCKIKAVTGIDCTDGVGRISGGEIFSTGDINCLVVGTREHAETHIVMGESGEFMQELKKLQSRIAKIDSEIEKINDQVNRIREKGKAGTATLEDEGFLDAALRVRSQKAGEKTPILERVEQLNSIVELAKKATIRAKTVIYGGTYLKICGFSQIINSDRPHASAYSNGTNIVIK
ncbi:MAG: DUF342 domain-containing protein [Ruminiclostridium sp.]|nr:DUF342 domain-containing protein [Ruminiclostridium sp.]